MLISPNDHGSGQKDRVCSRRYLGRHIAFPIQLKGINYLETNIIICQFLIQLKGINYQEANITIFQFLIQLKGIVNQEINIDFNLL